MDWCCARSEVQRAEQDYCDHQQDEDAVVNPVVGRKAARHAVACTLEPGDHTLDRTRTHLAFAGCSQDHAAQNTPADANAGTEGREKPDAAHRHGHSGWHFLNTLSPMCNSQSEKWQAPHGAKRRLQSEPSRSAAPALQGWCREKTSAGGYVMLVTDCRRLPAPWLVCLGANARPWRSVR